MKTLIAKLFGHMNILLGKNKKSNIRNTLRKVASSTSKRVYETFIDDLDKIMRGFEFS